MTQSGKTGIIAHVRRFDFLQFHNQNQLDLSGLVLLATYPKPSGNPYVWCRALMKLWSAWEWLYVAVQLCDVE